MTALHASTPHPTPSSPEDVLRELRGGPHRVVETKTSKVATWSFGSGPDLVLVHGWPLHAATFRDLVPALAQHFPCHRIDRPFAGQTRTDPDARLGLSDYARELGLAIDGLGLRRYAMLAHDSGAFMARVVAADHGDRVRGLVMGNTEIPGHTPWQLGAYLIMARLPGGEAIFRTSLKLRFIRHSNLAFGACFVDPAFADGQFGDLFVTPILDASETRTFKLLEHLDAAEMRALRTTHRRIQAPVKLVWGARDPFFPLPKAKAMLDQFGGPTELAVIEDGKLFVHEDRPEAFLAETVPFLRRHLAGVVTVAAAS